MTAVCILVYLGVNQRQTDVIVRGLIFSRESLRSHNEAFADVYRSMKRTPLNSHPPRVRALTKGSPKGSLFWGVV